MSPFCDGSAVGQARHSGENCRGASVLVIRVCIRIRLANENRLAAGAYPSRPKSSKHPEASLRSADLNRADVRVAHVNLIVRDHAAELHRLRQAFRLPHFAHE